MITNIVAVALAILLRVESNNQNGLIGDHGAAHGVLQEHTEMVREVNRLIDLYHLPYRKFTYKDRSDPQKSLTMARIYLTWVATYRHIQDPVQLAYRWNKPASGQPAVRYKKRVLAAYLKLRCGAGPPGGLYDDSICLRSR